MLGAGSVIAGKYRLESPIGKGGMGAVWRATHLALGRAVAVKFVLGDAPPEESLQRFLREARSLASVRHRNVVDVVDFGEHEHRPFLVMECLEGESLAQRLERPPPPTLAEIALWIGGALGGLAAIHDAGLVHRDLKPANLFLAQDADGVLPKVLDFGIARPSEASGGTITHSMQTLGTPHYMSPEQVRSAKSVDARSDVYAMGVLLYQALTGRLPFDGPSATAVIAAIVTDEAERVTKLRPDLPRSVADLVHRAMARDPAQRFADARAMRQALALAAQGHDVGASGELAGIGASATAATIPMSSPLGESSAETARRAPGAAKARSGRRGFLTIFGVLSTLMVAGLAGVSVTSMTASREGAPAVAATTGGAEGAPGGAPALGMVPAAPGFPAAVPGVPVRGATGAESTAAGSGEGSGGEARFVSAPSTLAALAIAIRDLPPDVRGCVRIVPHERTWAAYALPRCAARGPALIASLGAGAPAEVPPGAPTPEQLAAALEPALMETTTRSNVREGGAASQPLRRSLPESALVVALYGTIGAARSEAGGRGTWTRAVAAEGSEGWIASGLLRAWDHCVPRTAAVGGAHVIVGWTRLYEQDRESHGLLLLEPEGGSGDARSRARIATTDSSCAIGETIELPRGPEVIEEVVLTHTEREGGRTLVLLGVRAAGPRRADGTMRWRAYALREDAPLWEIELRTGQNLADTRRDGLSGPHFVGPEGEAGFWPVFVRIQRGDRTWYRWEDGALVVDRAVPWRRGAAEETSQRLE